MAVWTPWGFSDSRIKLAPGFSLYSTLMGGGAFVSVVRNKMIPAYIRLDNGWYDQDVEICRLVILYPSMFRKLFLDKTKLEYMDDALRILNAHHPDIVAQYNGPMPIPRWAGRY